MTQPSGFRIERHEGPDEFFAAPREPQGGWPPQPWDHRMVVGPDGMMARVAFTADGSPVVDADGHAVNAQVLLQPSRRRSFIRACWMPPRDPYVISDDLSDQARACLVATLDIGRDHGHTEAGPEHLLIAIARHSRELVAPFHELLDDSRLEECLARFNEDDAYHERLNIVAARRAGTMARPPALEAQACDWALRHVIDRASDLAMAARSRVEVPHIVVAAVMCSDVAAGRLGIDTRAIVETARTLPEWQKLTGLVEAGTGRLPSSSSWWHGLDPVSAEVRCGDATHVVRWQAGELILDDHDLEAEDALRALGAPELGPECLHILVAWKRCPDWPALQAYLGRNLDSVADAAFYEEYEKWRRERRTVSAPRIPVPANTPPGLRGPMEDLMGRAYRDADLVTTMSMGIRLMPVELRRILALMVGAAGLPPSEAGLVLTMSSVRQVTGSTAARVIGDSLVAHLGPESPAGRAFAEADERDRNVRGGEPAVLRSEAMEVHLKPPPLGAPPHVDIQFRDGNVTGELSVPHLWLSRIYARGVSNEHVVLEIVDESADRRHVTVSAARWEDDDRGPVLRNRRAELTESEPGVWSVRWLGE